MKNKFLNFINEKQAEIEESPLTYEQECDLIGTYPLTSRQPPSFHAMLCVLERSIPVTSRGEIIYMAISSAFDTFVSQYADYSSSPASGYRELFLTAYAVKCAKDSDSASSGHVSSAEQKARADSLLTAIRSGVNYDEILEEFSDLVALYSFNSKE